MPRDSVNIDILSGFLQASSWLSESLELTEILPALIDSAVELVDKADAGSLFLLDDQSGELVVRAVHNYGDEVLGLRLGSDEGIAGWVMKHRQPTIVDDFHNDPRIIHFPGQEEIAPIKSLLEAPLCVKDRVIGVLSFDNLSQTHAFTEDDLRIVRFFANTAAVAIERARLYDNLKQQNLQLQRLYERAEAAARLKSEFLNCATHELRTPICIIGGFAELMLISDSDPLTEKQRRWLETIHQNSQDMNNLINDIIDLSVLVAGQMTIFPEWFSLPPLIKDCLETAQRWVKGKPIEIYCQLSPDLPQLFIDRTRLRQILLSLLSNAGKFTKAGSITISAEPVAPGRFQLSVADTGIGISSEHSELIFEEFGRVDNSTTRGVGGLGLGLSITKHLCQLMGGAISVHSVEGQGTTFTVELPFSLSHQDPEK